MEKFKEMWANPRYKAIIKLGAWFVFLIVIVVFSSLSSPKESNNIPTDETQKEEVVFASLEEMQNNILVNSSKYNLKILNIVDNSVSIYTGEINEGIDVGYFESATEVYKYSCTLENCYKLYTDHQEEFEMESYPLLYINNVFEMIKGKEADITIKEENKIYKYNIDVQGYIWEIEITTSLTDIISIKEVTPKEKYEIYLEK